MDEELTADDKIVVQAMLDMKRSMALLSEAYRIFWQIRSSMSKTIYGDKIHGLTNEMDKFFREMNARKKEIEKQWPSEKL